MSNGVTVKRWTYDNAQRRVTAFRPISETAHSWSYDNRPCGAFIHVLPSVAYNPERRQKLDRSQNSTLLYLSVVLMF